MTELINTRLLFTFRIQLFWMASQPWVVSGHKLKWSHWEHLWRISYVPLWLSGCPKCKFRCISTTGNDTIFIMAWLKKYIHQFQWYLETLKNKKYAVFDEIQEKRRQKTLNRSCPYPITSKVPIHISRPITSKTNHF